ncbi:hypothetical protein FACS1894105_02520 [Clostridia bacterium]|nr:hypothetical protein FACS1894105_02520 [Clostridia bacterium]
MTKHELSQLYYLNREIAMQQRKLGELEALATNCAVVITGMPHGTGITDKVGNYAAEIADLHGLIDLNLKKCFFELSRLTRFINSIGDSQMRMILSMRYICGSSWQRIALSIGGGNVEDGVRRRVNRFISGK